MNKADAYTGLAERFGYPKSQRFLRILKMLLSPTEAELALELPSSTAELARELDMPEESVSKEVQLKELARRLCLSEEVVRETIDHMFARGAVLHRPKAVILPVWVTMLHDATLLRPGVGCEYYDAWQEFFEEEWFMGLCKEWLEATPREKVIPMWKAIESIPDPLPSEDLRQILAGAEILVIADCADRIRSQCTSYAVNNCLAWDRLAKSWLARGFAREVTKEEAIRIMGEAEEAGLVHTMRGGNYPIPAVCQCCTCCCNILHPLIKCGKLHEGLEKTSYEAVVDTGMCTGCQECIDRCIFDAIEMRKPDGSRRLKAQVDSAKCFGCGSCVVKCEPGAIKLKLVRQPAEPYWLNYR